MSITIISFIASCLYALSWSILFYGSSERILIFPKRLTLHYMSRVSKLRIKNAFYFYFLNKRQNMKLLAVVYYTESRFRYCLLCSGIFHTSSSSTHASYLFFYIYIRIISSKLHGAENHGWNYAHKQGTRCLILHLIVIVFFFWSLCLVSGSQKTRFMSAKYGKMVIFSVLSRHPAV